MLMQASDVLKQVCKNGARNTFRACENPLQTDPTLRAADERNDNQLPPKHAAQPHPCPTLLHQHSGCSATTVKFVISIMFRFFLQMPCSSRYWIVRPCKRPSMCRALQPGLHTMIYHSLSCRTRLPNRCDHHVYSKWVSLKIYPILQINCKCHLYLFYFILQVSSENDSLKTM